MAPKKSLKNLLTLSEPMVPHGLESNPFTVQMEVPPMQAILSPAVLKQHKRGLKKADIKTFNPGLLP